MTGPIDHLEERDDVRKTEYSRYDTDKGSQVTVELWHDPDGLQKIFQESLGGLVSPRGLRMIAKERALAVRETRIDMKTEIGLRAHYPETVERLEE